MSQVAHLKINHWHLLNSRHHHCRSDHSSPGRGVLLMAPLHRHSPSSRPELWLLRQDGMVFLLNRRPSTTSNAGRMHPSW